MLGILKEAWGNQTSRIVEYGVFRTEKGRILVEVPWIEKLTPTQLAQGRLVYGRRLPWGEWGSRTSDFDSPHISLQRHRPSIESWAFDKFRKY